MLEHTHFPGDAAEAEGKENLADIKTRFLD